MMYLKGYQITPSFSLRVLSQGGDVPLHAVDCEIDLKYFPDALHIKEKIIRDVSAIVLLKII